MEPEFRKSTRSGGESTDCVEVAISPGVAHAHLRDSKDAAGPVLTVPAEDWRLFTAAIKAGQL